MSDDTGYMLSGAEDDLESSRLRHIEALADPFTTRHFAAIGLDKGWRCLEIGAGGGSIARWLGEHIGSVVATDLDVSRLHDLPESVEVRRHDIAHEDLETATYDLVHCRAVLQHLADPDAALRRMVAALAPGGWILVEEVDFGLLELSGAPESARASGVLHDIFTRWTAAGVVDPYLGRRVPGLVGALGLDGLAVDAFIGAGVPGHSAYESFRQGWPMVRAGAAATGVVEDDLRCLDRAFATSTFAVTGAFFAGWAKKPQ
jgi:SAM-dependent methyltransferase